MNRKKVYLTVQTVLCLLIVIMLSLSALGIYREGSVRKAQHPLESVYTPEAVAEAFDRLSPLVFAAVGFAAAGLLLGISEGPEDMARRKKAKKQGQAVRKVQPGTGKKPVPAALPIALLLAGAVLVWMGVRNGGMRDVLMKAINICTECIGLG